MLDGNLHTLLPHFEPEGEQGVQDSAFRKPQLATHSRLRRRHPREIAASRTTEAIYFHMLTWKGRPLWQQQRWRTMRSDRHTHPLQRVLMYLHVLYAQGGRHACTVLLCLGRPPLIALGCQRLVPSRLSCSL